MYVPSLPGSKPLNLVQVQVVDERGGGKKRRHDHMTHHGQIMTHMRENQLFLTQAPRTICSNHSVGSTSYSSLISDQTRPNKHMPNKENFLKQAAYDIPRIPLLPKKEVS